MMNYMVQYNRAVRLREALTRKLWLITGAIPAVYEKPRMINNKVTLVHWTNAVIKECDALIIKIEIAKEIMNDEYALCTLIDKLNLIEEVV
jgi:intracellular septation protein A